MIESEENSVRESLILISHGQLEDACRVVAEFEASREFPRFGMSLSERDIAASLQMQEWIASLSPGVLGDCPNEVIKPARIGAAMMELWGTNTVQKYLSVDGDWNYRFSLDVVSRMILFRAYSERQLETFKAAGFDQVSIMGAGGDGATDSHSCEACRSINGKAYHIYSVPELPYPGCTCLEWGCRCIYAVD